MTCRFLALLAVALLPLAVTAGEAPETADVAGPVTWGGVDNVVRVGQLRFSAQPDEAALEAARANGVDVVVNLRDPDESDFDEHGVAEKLGLVYYNVPISRSSETLDEEALARIDALVREHGDQEILLHCSTGNRASAWFATWLAGDRGVPAEEAIARARMTGLTMPGMEKRVRTYLGAEDPDRPDGR